MTTENEKNPEEILSMSDEDFLKMTPPSAESTSNEIEESATEQKPVETSDEPTNQEDTSTNSENKSTDEPAEKQEEEPSKNEESDESEKTTDDGKSGVIDPLGSKEESSKDGDEKVSSEKNEEKNTKDELKEKTDSSSIDYKSFYEQVMTPFKANGKTIELRTPEEAIQLMQMGANYTRKMQEIAPHRKTLMMLENNNLMDEGKLSFLIDLDKKNPDAIKKLLKDSGIDPMDIDTDAEPTYKSNSYAVSEQDYALQTTLDGLKGTEGGVETIKVIHSTWDNASKEVLGKDPEIMNVIHQQRENGIYDRISGEIDRQKTLGTLPTGVSFLQAYKQVGDQMHEAGAFEDILGKKQVTPAAQEQEQKKPVATRVETPKPEVKNSEKASAASPAKSTPSPAKPNTNYLAMPDDEFLKLMNGRV